MRRFTDLLKRFRRDESGAFLVLFAVLALVLIATSGAVVDFTYMQTARSRAQNALDAAALALQSRISTDNNATLISKAQSMMTERLADNAITATVNTATVDTTNGKLAFQASVRVPTAFIQLVGIKSITAQLTSEVTKGSKNLEVSASLDITGSMAGTKITDLISATNTLIDLVVQTSQTPTYSRMAIVPWAYAVNVGSTYANSVRGTPIAGATISSATWMSGSAKTISAINTNSTASLTTSSNNGFTTGDYIWISGITGGWEMTGLNNRIFKVGSTTSATKFRLLNTDGTAVNTSGWNSFSTSGSPRVTKCLNSSCQVLVTTSSAHNLSAGDTVYISGTGVSALDAVHPTSVGTVPNTISYYLTDETAATLSYSTASSGSSYCTYYSCTYLYFQNASTYWNAGYELWQVNHCATERTTDAYTDVAPSTTSLGFNYTSGGTECVNQVIQPLTTNKTTLHNLANSLTAGGSTAGHLGLAWGWYMISPNFGYLWPTAPASYSSSNLIKAVILMTDGEFNVQYCNGVMSADSINGNDWDHINCNAPNGDSKTQATALCAQIKAQSHTTLYTVGFDLGTDTAALDFLQSCASDPTDFFRADTGTDLTNAFKQIAQNLNSLRLSH